MAADRARRTICLDVAIDHRIRRLFGPVSPPTREAGAGDHMAILEDFGYELRVPEDEIGVTSELAGPVWAGGIAVALQQPRDNHPFRQGTRAVIQDCATLAALDELFRVVSCGTLNLRSHVSVIDLLPYLPETETRDRDEETLDTMERAFRTSVEAICGKEPDVVLCSGRTWLGKEHDWCKGAAWMLESRGVGDTFGRHQEVRLEDQNGGFTRIQRVNGFHPSYALNYKPENSSLRQLQVLVVAETCAIARGEGWENETWMESIRYDCENISSRGRPAPGRGGQAQINRKKYLPEFSELYIDTLDDIVNTLTDLSRPARDTRASSRFDSADTYERLLESGLSSQCNDASLVLGSMAKLEETGCQAKHDRRNKRALREAAESTYDFTKTKVYRSGWLGNEELRDVIRSAVQAIRRSVDTEGRTAELDLDQASQAFLDLAEEIEVMLWDLSTPRRDRRRTTTSSDDSDQERDVPGLVRRLALY